MNTEEKINEKKEKTIEEMVIEEKPNKSTIEEMVAEEDKQDIIENYIEHIRKISELTDDEIESVMEEAIEEDEELLDNLRKFLEKREKIREKVASIAIETREDEDRAKSEKKEEIDDILEAFEDPDYAYPLEDIIKSLKESGYVRNTAKSS